MRLPLALALALVPATLRAQNPQLVAPTGPLTPAEEVKKFTVPAGFEVQLVAAEPDIQKPIQMAFDAKGRLWVTTSYHYPFAGPKGKSTDKLFVLSDFGPDGRARKVQTFAADLNIPIGILPLPDCNSCIVSSVGEIRKLTDTDGDGKADKSEVLFEGFGTRDTHGMYNSFTLMPDGWVYACHGFSNDSTVKGKDGHAVHMQSGHTFRFRPDGSRIEVYTRGQVNPFGMAIDPWFNLYTADCHSKPITQLIPGAYYDSFGKPHDGLGFAPHVTTHDHGSTALCGLTWYDAAQFPQQYKGCMFLGNVVTNRINFDRIEWRGATPVAKELPDFLVSKDPWFRPADIKLGPDGALYVTDFYNKIIGHYEVDLKHPGRDKDRGRVWRIVWRGEPGASATGAPKMPFTDLTQESPADLIAKLGSPNLTVRLAAMDQLAARARQSADSMTAIRDELMKAKTPGSYEAACWLVCNHPKAVPNEVVFLFSTIFQSRLDGGAERPIVHLLKAVASGTIWKGDAAPLRDLVKAQFFRSSPHVQRAALEVVADHPHPDFVKPLVELIQNVPTNDTHQRHMARIALRNCLRDGNMTDEAWKQAEALTGAADIVADVALGVPTAHAAKFLAGYVSKHPATPSFPAFAEHVGRYGKQDDRLWVLHECRHLIRDQGSEKQFGLGVQTTRQLIRGMQAGGHRLDREELTEFRFVSDKTLPLFKADGGAARLAVEVLALLPALGDDQGVASGELLKLVQAADLSEDTRGAAMDALSRVDPPRARPLLTAILNDPATGTALKEKTLTALANVPSREARGEVNVALKGAPYRVAVAVALNMAATKIGGEELLSSVRAGFMPARVLQERLVLERLKSSGIPDLDKQVAGLTKGLPPADQKLAALIKQRTARFASAKPDREAGAKLFAKHCAACHRIGDQGGKVGPNLDGVGVRGLERLLEDTLDPNRNVDAAFRARVLNLADGTTKTGLMLRVEGEVLVMADDQGKEFRVPTKDIESNRETALSPMPANFGEVIPEAEFRDLIGYLLEQRVKDPPKKP
jgi:putative membrane-bound dehydrogenase-like protein